MRLRLFPMKSYREWSIKTKLLAMTGLLLLCSVFFESYLSYTRYTRDFQRQSSEKVQQILDQVALNIDTYLDDLYRLTLYPYRNERIMQALEEPPGGTELEQLEKRRLIESFLEEIMIYPRGDIARVSVVTDEIYSSSRLPTKLVPDERLEEYDWYRQALATQEYIFVPDSGSVSGGRVGSVRTFSVVKQLRSISNSQIILGVIKADADYSGIIDILEKAEMGQDGGLYIVDAAGEFVYASTEQHKAAALGALQGFTHSKDGYVLNTAEVPRIGWTVVAVSSVLEMNREAIDTRNKALLFSVGGALIALLALIALTRHFLKPLLLIVKLMKEVELGRLDVTFQSSRRDEIGYLGSAFNRLVGRIGVMLQENTALVKEVYESKLLQQEAQINALFNQIRPHFIFNTLNLISLSMQSGKQEKAIEHINALSSILRGMSQWDKEMPLQKEVELLHAYLGIQSSRYEGRLSYTVHIDPSLYPHHVPALLLQPLVENAVVHVCERRKEPTVISITSKLLPGKLLLEVRDNGPGMDEETLGALRRRLEAMEQPAVAAGTRTGIGLVNVNKRIKARYGSAYGLSVESGMGLGTVFTITIPYGGTEERTHVQIADR
ncbi:sensor histidine kinase [Paenibacillus sp. PL2-23]|uniref:cache domain-containing sensor histidine kinase n=1 Tax=Paenibacillus sp. PL2-23 TaxID=2100729 RepID=UPI0030F594F9